MKNLGTVMKNDEKELQYLNYQLCQKELLHLKEGIKITEDVWNKYKAHILDLIASNKIKNRAAIEIQNRIMCLNNHWKALKEAWSFKLPQPEVIRDYDPFDPNPYQQYSVHKLLPKSTQQQKLDCFAKKITELHYAVQAFAYPCWLDRLYQFIMTSLLKVYNCLYAGSGNISAENVYITAAYAGEAARMPHYVPMKHNYFICQEKLSHNTAVLQDDLRRMKKWQTPSRPLNFTLQID